MPSVDPLIIKNRTIKAQNRVMIKSALSSAKGVKAKYLFLYIDAVEEDLIPEKLPKGLHLILLSKKKSRSW